MKQEHPQQQGPDLSERDEGPAERLGHQLGYAFGRLNNTMHHLGSRQHPEEAHHAPGATDQADQAQQPEQAEQATASSTNPHMSRAEKIVDDLGHRLNTTLSRSSAQLQKAGSRMREEAEDILAEAHHIRTPQTEETPNTLDSPNYRNHKARESR